MHNEQKNRSPPPRTQGCLSPGTGTVPGMDASLGDGDATLLHHLVDGRPIHVRHLVELVNADDTPANKSLLSRVLKRQLSSLFSSEIINTL
jgi:hypothetical protein